jgi:hypothetical protein
MVGQASVRACILASGAGRAWRTVLDWCRGLMTPRAYRPEAYYMRGPGPRWREKHAQGPDSGLMG